MPATSHSCGVVVSAATLRHGHGENVSEVVLPCTFRFPSLGASVRATRWAGQEAGVDSIDVTLPGCGVLFFNDGDDLALASRRMRPEPMGLDTRCGATARRLLWHCDTLISNVVGLMSGTSP